MDRPICRVETVTQEPQDPQRADAEVSQPAGFESGLVGGALYRAGFRVRLQRPGFSLYTYIYAPRLLVEIAEEGESLCGR